MGKKYTEEKAQSFFDKYTCFELLNFTGQDINNYYQEWQNSNHKNFNDFFWSLFNRAIIIMVKIFKVLVMKVNLILITFLSTPIWQISEEKKGFKISH